MRAPVDTDSYDEFGYLAGIAQEEGVDPGALLGCTRVEVVLDDDTMISAIKWGTAAPEYVFLHGGGQNAHTWDTLLVNLGAPALCLDLLGHGRSDRRADRDYGPWANASAAAEVIDKLRQEWGGPPVTVVGMSLGGASTIRLAAQRPDLFHHVAIVDVSPNVSKEGRTMTPEQRGSVALIGGPPTYESFDAMAEATIAMSPLRTPEAIRRGVRHNSVRLDDGKWMWRYDLYPREESAPMPERNWTDFQSLWDDVASLKAPTMVVKGGESVYVLPEDLDEYREKLPSVRIEVVAGAGHAVQSDQPKALRDLLTDFTS